MQTTTTPSARFGARTMSSPASAPLARGWAARARDNIRAITLSKEIEESGRAPDPRGAGRAAALHRLRRERAGAELLSAPRRRGISRRMAGDRREPGGEATTAAEYAALQRATQYAHYTPEPIIRAIWRAVQHLGFTGGRVLEPGMGTGLFFAADAGRAARDHPADRRRI